MPDKVSSRHPVALFLCRKWDCSQSRQVSVRKNTTKIMQSPVNRKPFLISKDQSIPGLSRQNDTTLILTDICDLIWLTTGKLDDLSDT